MFSGFGESWGVLGKVLGTLERLLGHLGGVFGDVGQPWGHHGSREAVLDALRRNKPGRPGSKFGQKGSKMAPKMGLKMHQNRRRK